jgi:hypothetical protein
MPALANAKHEAVAQVYIADAERVVGAPGRRFIRNPLAALHRVFSPPTGLGQTETIQRVNVAAVFEGSHRGSISATARCDTLELANTCSQCSRNASQFHDV